MFPHIFSSERQGRGARGRFTKEKCRISQRANSNNPDSIRILNFELIVGEGSFGYCFKSRRMGFVITPVFEVEASDYSKHKS